MPSMRVEFDLYDVINALGHDQLRELIERAKKVLKEKPDPDVEPDQPPLDIAPDIGTRELVSVLSTRTLSRHALYVAREAGLPI